MSTCYCINIRTISRRISAQYNDVFKPLAITVAQYSLLSRIKAHQTISITQLALECELERSTVGRNIKVLEKMNLVRTGTFSENQSDKRETQMELTDLGVGILHEARQLWEAKQKEIEGKLGGKEKAKELLDLLNQI
ncbi:MarR family winged helix-turn-helix transcriptional regulator [Sutcliffiella horikoshii]|uniref:MarR family winged helix-turn-helix transcriptional regulator n=1 Tax=Sutcliffiella horikoshii TaxID=79883 RepID=UPI00203E52E3|nr:MarR family winged helix-turn-helix transcriptional regulator [Sutcliffiella horikoshii]MCM3618402.1 MarR family winged helix-turn-helix transcriptional regulator [Sutcliffiella horikoshii]